MRLLLDLSAPRLGKGTKEPEAFQSDPGSSSSPNQFEESKYDGFVVDAVLRMMVEEGCSEDERDQPWRERVLGRLRSHRRGQRENLASAT